MTVKAKSSSNVNHVNIFWFHFSLFDEWPTKKSSLKEVVLFLESGEFKEWK